MVELRTVDVSASVSADDGGRLDPGDDAPGELLVLHDLQVLALAELELGGQPREPSLNVLAVLDALRVRAW